MYLKRLEIFGFKSFAEKTELEFGPGITAVVGPNGSGKSNVSDAVRWVLGEQSARALRGGNMADVIFAGSDSKKAMGFAQVSLVLDNSDGKLGVGYTEVMVTRRVDRSGEGEYFINQVACRLKDVQDLFLDTGIGKDNYSIIGQGKIDEILSSKPEDRRALFEEAAGISRYKARKREAQRRLEETEQNLLRINDIIGELGNQIESLADQAHRAEVYSELNGELTQLDVGLVAHALEAVVGKLQRQVDENQQLTARLSDIDWKLQEGEQAAEVARNLVASLDQELSVVATGVSEATGQLERAEGHLALAGQEQRSSQAEGQRLEAELTSLEAKLASLETEVAAVVAQACDVEAAVVAATADLSEQELSQVAAQGEVAAASRAVETLKNRIITILQSEAEKKNAALSADKAGEDAARRMTRLAGERERAETEIAQAENQAAAVLAEQGGLQVERNGQMTALRDLKQKRNEAEQAAQELQQRGGTVREQIQGASARLGAIEEMMNAFEGYQKGTRTVLQGKEKGLPFATDVLGAVVNVMRTEPKFEKAIEIALGGGIQNIITATDGGAKQAIEHLKRTNGGRATFLPLNVIRANGYRADEEREFRNAPGILGVALDLVRFEDRFRPALASLLGRVLIAEHMDAALAFGRKTGMRYRIVTLDGELLSAGGALTGGSTGGQGSGLLSRERERDELTAKVSALREELPGLRKRFEEAQADRARLDEAIQVQEREIRSVETRITQTEGETARIAGELRRWHELLETFATEAEGIAADVEAGATSAEGLRAELAQLSAERSQLETEVVRLNDNGQARLAELEEQGRTLTLLQVAVAERNEQLRGFTAQRSRLEAEQTLLLHERETKQAQHSATLVRIEQASHDLAAAQVAVAEAGHLKRQTEDERNRVQTRKLEAMEQTNGREREMRQLRRSQTDTQSKLQQGEVEEARLQMEQENLVTRLQEQYGMAPADIAGRALPDAGVVTARERTQELREQIRELGPVNLQAIEEHKAAHDRFGFLERQRTDLDEAKSALYRAVAELDKRIKTHFLESFEVIREHFQQVYQELFEGGKADLKLIDENDLLETGIEIIAQPPGKKPQTLSLLSGGERAMTAIALLFALLRVKPTPFVILDEVEAALDEANVERFGRYLRIFAEKSNQFICISHQRGTMEAADALYGVTMEGTGVSRVVSVRLIDLEQQAS